MLTSLPGVHSADSYRSLLLSAGLDQQAFDHLSFDAPPAQCVPLLIDALYKYGRQTDERHPLLAVLEAAHDLVGSDRQAECQTIIREAERYCR